METHVKKVLCHELKSYITFVRCVRYKQPYPNRGATDARHLLLRHTPDFVHAVAALLMVVDGEHAHQVQAVAAEVHGNGDHALVPGMQLMRARDILNAEPYHFVTSGDTCRLAQSLLL
jgi:hypothetical protein